MGKPVYEPTDALRRLLVDVIDQFEREPDAGQEWDEVQADLWPV